MISGLRQMIARATRPPSRKPRRATLATTGRPPSPTARRWPRPGRAPARGGGRTRGEGERGEPQRRDRVELLGAADGPRADLEERVRRDSGDEQGRGDRDRALGQRSAQRGGSGHGLGFGHGVQRLPTRHADEAATTPPVPTGVDGARSSASVRAAGVAPAGRTPSASALQLAPLTQLDELLLEVGTRSAVSTTRPMPAYTASRPHSMICSALGRSMFGRSTSEPRSTAGRSSAGRTAARRAA